MPSIRPDALSWAADQPRLAGWPGRCRRAPNEDESPIQSGTTRWIPGRRCGAMVSSRRSTAVAPLWSAAWTSISSSASVVGGIGSRSLPPASRFIRARAAAWCVVPTAGTSFAVPVCRARRSGWTRRASREASWPSPPVNPHLDAPLEAASGRRTRKPDRSPMDRWARRRGEAPRDALVPAAERAAGLSRLDIRRAQSDAPVASDLPLRSHGSW